MSHYTGKLTGALKDRIDLFVHFNTMPKLDFNTSNKSKDYANTIQKTRDVPYNRNNESKNNSLLS